MQFRTSISQSTFRGKIMAKKTAVATAVASFASVSDIALNHGRSENNVRACAAAALASVKGFPVLKDVSDEDIQSLRDGYALAHREIFSPKTYAVINGHYVLAMPDHGDNVEKINLTLDYCMSYTSNEMGTAFKDRPQLKELIGKVRKAHQTYVSDCLGKLVRKAEELIREQSGEKQKRDVVLFTDSLVKVFDAQTKSVKNKQKRGDATANPAKYLAAVEAFWKTYKA